MKKTINQQELVRTFFAIQDREAGNIVDIFNSEAEAEKELIEYEKNDKEEGIYFPDFYEIVEVST